MCQTPYIDWCLDAPRQPFVSGQDRLDQDDPGWVMAARRPLEFIKGSDSESASTRCLHISRLALDPRGVALMRVGFGVAITG